MAVWPAGLPQNQFVNMSVTQRDARIIAPTDTGPPKMRRRATAVSKLAQVPIVLKGSEKQTFDDFFNDTLEHGSLSFDWTDPTTDETFSFRFDKQMPKFTLVAGGSTSARLWQGTLFLEILP